jgi:lipopolysaccharide biosynthesis glycosyltransferase
MDPASFTVAVACAADANYALPLTVTLTSAGLHAAPGVRIEAYILDDGLTPEDRRRIVSSLPANVRVEWRAPASAVNGLPVWGRMSSTTYQKLTLDEWLPKELDRVIWLDCDLLVVADLGRLWQSAGTGTVSAVQDQRVPAVSSPFGVAGWRELGLSAASKYFNAGVLVIDLAQWRGQGIRLKSIDYIRAFADRVYFWDQEALNAILEGKWSELDSRWNWHPSLPGAPESGDPSIIHFSGNLKPWKSANGGPWRTLYHSYLDRISWAGTRPAPRWRDKILAWYETSSLRRLLYPAEGLATSLHRNLTRR